MSEGVPCPAEVEAQPPLLARAWIKAWADLGGGVTIARNGNLHPWLNPEAEAVSEEVKSLLSHLKETPGLPRAVRIVLRTRAASKRKAA